MIIWLMLALLILLVYCSQLFAREQLQMFADMENVSFGAAVAILFVWTLIIASPIAFGMHVAHAHVLRSLR